MFKVASYPVPVCSKPVAEGLRLLAGVLPRRRVVQDLSKRGQGFLNLALAVGQLGETQQACQNARLRLLLVGNPKPFPKMGSSLFAVTELEVCSSQQALGVADHGFVAKLARQFEAYAQLLEGARVLSKVEERTGEGQRQIRFASARAGFLSERQAFFQHLPGVVGLAARQEQSADIVEGERGVGDFA